MPTRMLHEKICDSATLAELTGDEERLFHRLVVKADDYGRFHAHPSLILGACFPLLIGKVDVETVREWRNRLVEVGLIALYTVDGREYLHLVTWEAYQRQRGSKPKFPSPLEGAETCGESPQGADICGSRVVKTGYPVDDSRKTIDVDDIDAREAHAANGADAPTKPKRGSTGKTSPPGSFEPNEADYAAGRDVGLGKPEVDAKVGAMLDHFRAKGEQRADWHATFRTWIRNAVKFDRPPPARASPPSQNGSTAPPSGPVLARASAQRVNYLYRSEDSKHAT